MLWAHWCPPQGRGQTPELHHRHTGLPYLRVLTPPPSSYSACSYVKRMKEFERERRLLQRKKRRQQREADVARGQGSGEVGPGVAL